MAEESKHVSSSPAQSVLAQLQQYLPVNDVEGSSAKCQICLSVILKRYEAKEGKTVPQDSKGILLKALLDLVVEAGKGCQWVLQVLEVLATEEGGGSGSDEANYIAALRATRPVALYMPEKGSKNMRSAAYAMPYFKYCSFYNFQVDQMGLVLLALREVYLEALSKRGSSSSSTCSTDLCAGEQPVAAEEGQKKTAEKENVSKLEGSKGATAEHKAGVTPSPTPPLTATPTGTNHANATSVTTPPPPPTSSCAAQKVLACLQRYLPTEEVEDVLSKCRSCLSVVLQRYEAKSGETVSQETEDILGKALLDLVVEAGKGCQWVLQVLEVLSTEEGGGDEARYIAALRATKPVALYMPEEGSKNMRLAAYAMPYFKYCSFYSFQVDQMGVVLLALREVYLEAVVKQGGQSEKERGNGDVEKLQTASSTSASAQRELVASPSGVVLDVDVEDTPIELGATGAAGEETADERAKEEKGNNAPGGSEKLEEVGEWVSQQATKASNLVMKDRERGSGDGGGDGGGNDRVEVPREGSSEWVMVEESWTQDA